MFVILQTADSREVLNHYFIVGLVSLAYMRYITLTTSQRNT